VSKALEYSPRHPHHTAVLADLDPELHRLPVGIPAGVLGVRPFTLSAPDEFP
jgi:hypothetical protein